MKKRIRQINVISGELWKVIKRVDVIKSFAVGGRILCLCKSDAFWAKYLLYDYESGVLIKSADTQNIKMETLEYFVEEIKHAIAERPEYYKTINSEKIEKGMEICLKNLPADPEERQGFIIQMQIMRHENEQKQS